jgi:hypothetical protein
MKIPAAAGPRGINQLAVFSGEKCPIDGIQAGEVQQGLLLIALQATPASIFLYSSRDRDGWLAILASDPYELIAC